MRFLPAPSRAPPRPSSPQDGDETTSPVAPPLNEGRGRRNLHLALSSPLGRGDQLELFDRYDDGLTFGEWMKTLPAGEQR